MQKKRPAHTDLLGVNVIGLAYDVSYLLLVAKHIFWLEDVDQQRNDC